MKTTAIRPTPSSASTSSTAAAPKRKGPLLSPLRYPGGKRRLVRYIGRLLEMNELRPALFVEPFAGGASVSLYVLERGLAERIVLNDRDPLVSGFWKTVFDPAGNAWLAEQVMRIPVTLDEWRRYKGATPSTDRERALACLFLNRTSFSGILHRKAGPLGGYTQTSDYKIDCRFPRETLARRIRDLAAYSNRVLVWGESWRGALARVRQMQAAGTAKGRACYYLDPPFFEKAEDLYRFCFGRADHVALRDAVLSLADDWILSYDVAEGLREVWHPAALTGAVDSPDRAHIELLYSMPQRVATEAILSNLDLPGSHTEDLGLEEAPRAVTPAGDAPLESSPPSSGACGDAATGAASPGAGTGRGPAPLAVAVANADPYPLVRWEPVRARRDG